MSVRTGEKRNVHKVFGLRRKRPLGDLGIDGRIIYQEVLRRTLSFHYIFIIL
jgi:hypothetical protein